MTSNTESHYVGLVEFKDMDFIVHPWRKEDLIIDKGANIGIYTVLAPGVCQSKPISFERIDNTLIYLNENMKFIN